MAVYDMVMEAMAPQTDSHLLRIHQLSRENEWAKFLTLRGTNAKEIKASDIAVKSMAATEALSILQRHASIATPYDPVKERETRQQYVGAFEAMENLLRNGGVPAAESTPAEVVLG